MEARDLLDEIDFGAHVRAPARHSNLELAIGCGQDLEARMLQVPARSLHRHFVAEHLCHSLAAYDDFRGRMPRAGDIDGCFGDRAARQRDDQAHDSVERHRRELRIDTALEAITRVRVETERAACRSRQFGIEARDLDEEISRVVGDLAVAAAHHAGDGLRLRLVRDDDARRRQRARDAVERDELFSGPRHPHDHGRTAELVKIERVNRLAELVQHVIGRIHHVADGANADGLQTSYQPVGTRTDPHAAHHRSHVASRRRIPIDAHANVGSVSLTIRSYRSRQCRPEILDLGQLPRPRGDRGKLARNAEMREQVGAVGADVDDQTRVPDGHDREQRCARLRHNVELEYALMVIPQAELFCRAQHAVRDDTADLSTLDRHAVRQRCPDRGEWIHATRRDVRRAAHDLEQFPATRVDLGGPQVVRVRMRLHFCDPRDDDGSEVRSQRDELLDRRGMRREQVAKAFRRCIDRDERAQPLV